MTSHGPRELCRILAIVFVNGHRKHYLHGNGSFNAPIRVWNTQLVTKLHLPLAHYIRKDEKEREEGVRRRGTGNLIQNVVVLVFFPSAI